MGEASSEKVSDREIFASCHLRDTFKVWSLVYTWRYSFRQDESIGCVVEQWRGESSGSRRVWRVCVFWGAQPFLARAQRKGTFLGPPLCPRVSKGSLSLGKCGWAEPNPAQGEIQNRNLQNGWFKQTNKQRSFLLLCNKNPLICVSPAQLPLPGGSACVWGRSLCSHEQPSVLQH